MDLGLTGYRKDSHITIMGTGTKKFRDEDGRFHECLTLVYKDTDTGIKHQKQIVDPKYEFYTVKPEYRTTYNRLYIEKEKCNRHVATRIGLDKAVAESLGMLDWFKETIRSGDRDRIRSIHKHPDVFMSDNNIEDHYRFWFDQQYANDICQITKCFFDIEVDTKEIDGRFPDMGECPINAISVLYPNRNELYTFLLRTKSNIEKINEFENYVRNGGIEECKRFILDYVSERNTNKQGEKFYFGLENLSIKVLFYNEEDEINLIKDFFNTINKFKPDFALAWNQAFDVPYMIARILNLGYQPEDIICHPDFEYKQCYYYIDERNKNDYEERCDYFACTSYTIFIDQMINFASRRKGQTKLLSYSLDFIGNLVGHVRKLDYKNITTRIEELPYIDFMTFVLYNMCDTIVQHCIEHYSNDIEFIFGKVVMNNTRYSKIHRQTVYLTNRGQKVLWNEGFVKGNNVNLNNPKKPYPGAFVADPKNLSDKPKMKINGSPVNILNNLYDADFKAMYPSNIRQFNTFANTMVGYIIISHKIHTKENRSFYEHYTRGGQFIEDIHSHQWIEFANRWLGLPDFAELVDRVKYTYSTEITPSSMYALMGKTIKNNDGYKMPIVVPGNYKFPIYVNADKNGYTRPIHIASPIPDEVNDRMKGWLNHVVSCPNQSF